MPLSLARSRSLANDGSRSIRGVQGIKGEVAITGSHPEIGHFSLVFKDAGLGNVNRVVKIPRSTQQVIKTLLPDLSRTHVLGLRLNDDSQFLVEEHVKRELERSHAVLQREWTTNREKLRAESLRATGKPVRALARSLLLLLLSRSSPPAPTPAC